MTVKINFESNEIDYGMNGVYIAKDSSNNKIILRLYDTTLYVIFSDFSCYEKTFKSYEDRNNHISSYYTFIKKLEECTVK